MYYIDFTAPEDAVLVGQPGLLKDGKGTYGLGTRIITMTDVPGCTTTECSANHWRERFSGSPLYGGRRWSERPAKTAWVALDWNGKAKSVVFLCSKHTGTLRSLRSRGVRGYGSDYWRPIHENPSTETLRDIAVNPAEYMKRAEESLKVEQHAAIAARKAYVKENTVEKLVDHLSITQYVPIYSPYAVASLGDGEEKALTIDEFGRAFVNIGSQKLTPVGATILANRLMFWAEVARTKSEAALAAAEKEVPEATE